MVRKTNLKRVQIPNFQYSVQIEYIGNKKNKYEYMIGLAADAGCVENK